MTRYNKLEKAVDKLIQRNETRYILERDQSQKEALLNERGLLMYVYKGITGKNYLEEQKKEFNIPTAVRNGRGDSY